jgi:hypothetical protein
MLQRVAWLLLLAVIVSTQVFTVACDTRCGRAAIAGEMAGGRCACMQSDGQSLAVVMPAMGSMCKDLLCKDDSASITNAFQVARSEIAWMPVWVDVPAWTGRVVVHRLSAGLRRSWVNRSWVDHGAWAPALDPLRI